jgi:hypothetical protein
MQRVQGRSLTAEFMLGLRHIDRKVLWCLCRGEMLPWRGVPCLPPGARFGCLRHECLAARFNGVDIEVRLSRQQEQQPLWYGVGVESMLGETRSIVAC